MATPYVSGDRDIALRLLSGQSRCLYIGDSIGVALFDSWFIHWRNPIAGYGVMGIDSSFAASNANQDCGTGALGVTGLLTESAYSAFGTREIKFTGSAYGAVANGLSNVFFAAGGTLWGEASRTINFTALDWAATATDLEAQLLIYRNATSCSTGQFHVYRSSSFVSPIADFGTLALNNADGPTHTLYTAPFTSQPTVDSYAFQCQHPAGSPVASSNVVVAHSIIWSPSTAGLTLLPAVIGGNTVGKWLVDTIRTETAITQSLGALDLDMIIVSLTNNQPNVNGAGDPIASGGGFASAAQYEVLLTAMVARLRTACPDASIVFIPTYDTSGSHQSDYATATYNVQQETPNSCMLNLFRACGAWANWQATLLSDGVHPTAAGRVAFISRIEMLAEELVSGRLVDSGANTITVGEAVDELLDVCRNAGIRDDNNLVYSEASRHRALRFLLEKFVHDTGGITVVSDFTITEDDEDVDLSGITGFAPNRFKRAWIDEETQPINCVGIDEVIGLLAANATSSVSGKPCKMAFIGTTAVAKLDRVSDADYAGKVEWTGTLVSWTMGSASASDIVINMPADLVREIIRAGGIYALQANQPEHADLVTKSQAAFMELLTTHKGTNNVGERVHQRVTSRRRRYMNLDNLNTTIGG